MRIQAIIATSLLFLTPLAHAQTIHDAAKKGDLEAMKKMLAESPFLRKSINTSGQTPGAIAAYEGQTAIVEYLLGTGLSVNDPDSMGRTLLMNACEGGKFDLVKLLITKHRASVTAKDVKGWTVVHFASRKNPPEMLQYLLDQRADPNVEDEQGNTPLMLAVGQKLLPQSTLLVERKADVNKVNKVGRTALHIAAEKKVKALVELLIKAGAKAGGKDRDGKTAMDIATAAGAPELVPLLEKTVSKKTGPTKPSKDKKSK